MSLKCWEQAHNSLHWERDPSSFYGRGTDSLGGGGGERGGAQQERMLRACLLFLADWGRLKAAVPPSFQELRWMSLHDVPPDLIFPRKPPPPHPNAKCKEHVVHCHSLHAGNTRLSALQTLISQCLNVVSIHRRLTSEAPSERLACVSLISI